MNKYRKLVTFFLTLSLLLVNVTTVLAVPPQPNSFYGTAKLNGENVALGTVISAWINGVRYAYGVVLNYEGDTVYAFDVPGDDSYTEEIIEGGVPGDTVIFHIGDLVADQSAPWRSGRNVPLNLTATVNRPPVITEGDSASVTMSEDGSPTAFALTLNATDLDSADTLNWSVLTQGAHGIASALGTGPSVTVGYAPQADAFGTDSFVVQVSDGHGGADSIIVNVTIEPRNDIPLIAGQHALSTPEETALTVTLADLIVTDVDNTYPTGFSLTLQAGAHYSLVGNTLTPALNYTGVLSVPVTVNDGTDSSLPFALEVTVGEVNDAPVIDEGATADVSMSEDSNPTAFSLTLHATDADSGDTLAWSVAMPAVNGAASATGMGTSRAVTYTPNQNFNGADSFVVQVVDGHGGVDSITVNVTIASVNDAPTFTEISPVEVAMSEEGTPDPFVLTLHASDVEGDTLTWGIATQAGSGTATATGNGNAMAIGYVPNPNFSGSDSFVVRVVDGHSDSATITVHVTVGGTNDAPVITNGASVDVTMSEDSNPDAFSLTLNATDADGDTLTWLVTTLAGSGAASADGTGASQVVTYIPNANYSGSDSFVVRVSDGNGGTDTIIINVTIEPRNDAPVITEGDSRTVTMSEDSNPTAFSLTLHATDADAGDTLSWSVTTPAGNGTADATGTGASRVVTYTPNPNYFGADSFVVQVVDGNGGMDSITVHVTIASRNDAPVISGQAGALTTPEETALTIVLANVTATDVDSTITSLSVQNGNNYTHVGNIITPAVDFNGTLTVPVTVSDGSDASAPFNLTVSVTPLNDLPVITGQYALSTTEETPLTVTLADLIVTDVDNAYPTGFSLTLQAGGHYSLVGNTLTPELNFTGSLSVPVTVYDGTDSSAPYLLTVTVNGTNDAPVISEGASADVSMSEDSNPTAFSLTLHATDPDSGDMLTWSVVTPAGSGAVLANGTGASQVVTYTPNLNYNGSDSFVVQVADGHGGVDSITINVTIDPRNDAPVINNQAGALSTLEDTPLTITLADVTISDPDSATFSLAVQSGTSYNFVDNTITPTLNFNGNLTVPVIVSDGSATSAAFNLTVSVTPVNDPPVIAQGESIPVSMSENGWPTAFELTLSATDPDDSSFTWSIVTAAQHGTAGASGTGASPVISYIPFADYHGPDSFVVRVSDGHSGGTDTITVNVTIQEVNISPVIGEGGSISVPMDEDGSPVAFGLTLHATDADPGDTLAWTVATPAGNGVASASGTGPSQVVTYTPNANYYGADSFVVQVSDGNGGMDSITVHVTIASRNDAPVISGQAGALTTPEETALTIVLANVTVTDVDSATLTLTVQNGASYTHVGNIITPAVDFNGDLHVPVIVNDSIDNSAPFNLTVSVTPLNDIPLITKQKPLSTSEETPLTIQLSDLTIQDPDSTEFTLNVLNGNNYTHSGSAITPAVNFNGILTIPVTVSDDQDTSAVFDLHVTVIGNNDTPVILDQKTLTTQEDTALEILVSDLIIVDPDSTTFSLSARDGLHYTRVDNTITPAADYYGVLTVPVTVSDGGATSAVYNVTVTVNEVNDAPRITGQAGSLTTPEETSLAITLANVNITDPDSTGFTLTVLDGPSYTHNGNTITPAHDFNGALLVAVKVTDDRLADSASFNLTVNVTGINDAPVINGQAGALSTLEDKPLTILLANLTVTDPDSTNLTLIVLDGTNYSHTGNTITPTQNYFGTLTVPVRVQDEELLSNVYNLTVLVTSVNDLPVIGEGANMSLTISEDGSPAPFALTLHAADADNDTLTWSIATLAAHGTAGASGTGTTKPISYSPHDNYYGPDSFVVRVTDSNGGWDEITIHLTIQPENDAPVITEGAAVSVTMTRNSVPTAFALTLHATDAEGSGLTWTILSSAGHGAAGASGTGASKAITYTPNLDYVGTDSFVVQVADINGATDTIVVNVTINETQTIKMYLPLIAGRK